MKRVLLFAGVAAAIGCGADHVASPRGVTLPAVPSANVSLALGAQFSCALTNTAQPVCWGDGESGEIGDSTFVSKFVPSSPVGGHAFIAIAAGSTTACALDRTGTAWCWGDDPSRPTAPLSFADFAAPIPADRPFKAITVGRKFGCALDGDGSAYCWGLNDRGQLGVGDTTSRVTATHAAVGLHFIAITAGFWHVCALTASGAAYCWGDNQYGEMGTGDTLSSSVPRAVAGSVTFTSLSAGSIHQCGVSITGGAFCWGGNYAGQLGDGTAQQRTVPTAVASGLAFVSIHGGRVNAIFGHTCGLAYTGDVYCWGYNSKGQIGSTAANDPCIPFQAPGTAGGDTTVKRECSYTPVRVAGIVGAVTLDVGEEHTCALTVGAQIYCWGDNAHGELGDGSGVARSSPAQITGGWIFPSGTQFPLTAK